MTSTLPQFPAPEWADPEASSAVSELDTTTVFWVGVDHSTDPSFQLRLVKVDGVEDGVRWSSIDAELNGRGGDITLRNPQEAQALIEALQRLCVTWQRAEA